LIYFVDEFARKRGRRDYHFEEKKRRKSDRRNISLDPQHGRLDDRKRGDQLSLSDKKRCQRWDGTPSRSVSDAAEKKPRDSLRKREKKEGSKAEGACV